AAVVTVFGVSAPPIATPTRTSTRSRPDASVEWAGTQIVSAIGPGESGRTKYEVQYIQSRVVLHQSGLDPVTIVKDPMTATFTHEQGGNVLIEKGDPAVSIWASGSGQINELGKNVECQLDTEKNTGVCAGEHLYANLIESISGTQVVFATVTQTVGTTYTGNLIPLATITTGAAAGMSSIRSTALLLATVALGAFISI
ncbi:hypothetical protein CVT24_001836, partial [Panaeolus cyanescens]